MSISEHRLSTIVKNATWLDPDGRDRALDEDYEAGPLAFEDTSLGLQYQPWKLTWDFASSDFTATPETTGSPEVGFLNVANVTQCSLAFDQNAHINVAYTVANVNAYLYWYDTQIANWTTTALPAGAVTPTLTMDDKRQTQTAANDIILFYTKPVGGGVYNLYSREQRDRFLIEYDMGEFPQYLYKVGLHNQLRIQIGGSESILP